MVHNYNILLMYQGRVGVVYDAIKAGINHMARYNTTFRTLSLHQVCTRCVHSLGTRLSLRGRRVWPTAHTILVLASHNYSGKLSGCRPQCFHCGHTCRPRAYIGYARKYSYSYTRPIHATTTCKTRNVMYLIECRKCRKQYVGETQNLLHICLNGHRNDITHRDTSSWPCVCGSVGGCASEMVTVFAGGYHKVFIVEEKVSISAK